MYKKRILGLAIASAFTLTGCLNEADPNYAENGGSVSNPDITSELPEALDPAFSEGKVWPVFNPGESKLPIPNDLIYQKDSIATEASEADGTYEVADSSPPVTTALNELSGASTIAPIDIPLSGEVNPVSVVANGTVFLIALDYASGSPLQALSISEPPTVNPANQPSFNVTVESYDGGTNNVIRINLDEPLLPNTRYVVGLSKSILDGEGEQIIGSPGLTGYAYLTDPDPETPLASDALTSVVSLIDFWERTIVGFTAAVPAIPDVSSDQIAMSYSFTTSNDEKVLSYIADPSLWVNDQLVSMVRLAGAEAAITGGATTYTDTLTGADAAFNGWLPSSQSPALGSCDTELAGQARFDCAAETIITELEAGTFGITADFPTPEAQTVSFNTGAGEILDINQVSAITANLGIPLGTVSVSQGTMDIPYFLDAPSGANGIPLITGNWEADDTLAAQLGAVLDTTIPQSDNTISTAVSAIFPFPKVKSTETIPVLAIFPTSPIGVPATGMKTVIFQHGITTDRSAALAFGASLVAGAAAQGQDVAVIAIDQPLHGIDGISPAEQAALAEQLLSAGGIITPDGTFDGVDADAGDQQTINAVVAGLFSAGIVSGVDAATNSGALGATNCVDLATNGLETTTLQILGGLCDADPVVDAVIGQDASVAVFSAQTLERTVANGASTIAGLGQGADTERHFGFTSGGPGAAPLAMDYNGSASTNSSGSMFINLTNFLGSRDNLRQGSVDLMNLRLTIGDMDINGGGADLDPDQVYFIGHSLGTVNGLPFLAATNNSSTTADDVVAANLLTPGGGLTRFLENSPTFGPTIVGGLLSNGLTQDSSSYQSYLNILQAALDSADAINTADQLTTPTLLSEVIGDTVIPNLADTAQDFYPSSNGTGSVSNVSGTEAVAIATGADLNVVTGSSAVFPLTQNIVRYTEGFHGTPVFPSTGTAEESSVFAEMVTHATSIVLSGGAAVSVDNSGINVIQ